jgi:hypothetical protein
MPGHHGGHSSSSSSSSSRSSGPAGGASAGGNYGGNSSGGTSSNNMSNTGGGNSGGGGQSWSPASGSQGTTITGKNVNTSKNVNTTSTDNDNRLNYITGDYLDIDLNSKQKEELQDYRKNVEEAINPMAKYSNMAIGIGLNQLIPGAGYLFGHYKQSTAMGYKMTNPLTGLTDKFGNAKDWVEDKLGGLLDGSNSNFFKNTVGQSMSDRDTMNTLAPLASYIVSETTPDESQASKWYNSIGENTESTFNFAKSYADAKTKVTNNLKNHGPLAQLAVSDSPYYDWLKKKSLDKGIL